MNARFRIGRLYKFKMLGGCYISEEPLVYMGYILEDGRMVYMFEFLSNSNGSMTLRQRLDRDGLKEVEYKQILKKDIA